MFMMMTPKFEVNKRVALMRETVSLPLIQDCLYLSRLIFDSQGCGDLQSLLKDETVACFLKTCVLVCLPGAGVRGVRI